MQKDTITRKQGFTLVITFVLCNSFSMLFGSDAGRDLWLAYLLASVLTVFIGVLLLNCFERHHFNSIFDMLDFAFGKVFGHILSSLLLIYALLSCTSSMSLFSRFTQLTALTKTPQIVLPLFIVLLAAWSLKSGLSILSHGASLLFYFVILTFAYFVFFGLPQLDIRNALPILENGIFPPLRSALTVFTNQFGDILLLFAIYPKIRKSEKRPKTFFGALLTATIISVIIAVFTVLTLGGNQLMAEYFPVFTILSIRSVGGYIQHMEILTSVAMTFFIFIRQTISIYFAASAISHLFHTDSYRAFVTPLALIIVCGTQLMYWNMMSLITRLEGNMNLYILLPLQFILPCAMSAVLIFKRKKEK